MSLNPAGMSSNKWNYSDPNKDGYSQTIVGTVLALQEVQRREFNRDNPGQGRPMTWNDGTPRMSIRMIMVNAEGQLKTFTFQPAGKEARAGRKKSIHMDLFNLAGGRNMTDLIGKTIIISTWEPENGFKWGQGNPRPFECALSTDGPFTYNGEMPAEYKLPKVLCDEAVSGGHLQPQPQQRQQYVYPAPSVQGTYAPQPQQPMPQFSAQQFGPVLTQPQQIMPLQQPQPQQNLNPATPMQAQMPQGMDPNVMAAMQQMGAVNVQPVQASPYDEDIPF